MKVFILFLTLIFFNSIFSSPQCILTLFCYKYCNDLKLKNGINNGENGITLTPINTYDANYKKYTETFDCQPGDSISFKSYKDNSADDKVGIIGEIEFSHKRDNTNIKYTTTTSDRDKFGCDTCESLEDTTFTISETNYYLYGKGGSEFTELEFVIEIPYGYSITENPKNVNNVIPYQFQFKDLFETELVDAETNERIKVKITQSPLCISDNSHSGKLLKGTDEITTGTELSL